MSRYVPEKETLLGTVQVYLSTSRIHSLTEKGLLEFLDGLLACKLRGPIRHGNYRYNTIQYRDTGDDLRTSGVYDGYNKKRR
jgi:hypothetical protein